MTPRRLILALVPALVLAAAATPAHATLLVRSDGAGMLVQDKNGLNDGVQLLSATRNGKTVFRIVNYRIFDVFPFDFQTGCGPGADREAICDRTGGAASFVMGSGADQMLLGSAPAGTFAANMGSGNDDYRGNPGTDNVDGLAGDDILKGAAGSDDLDGGDDDDRMVGEAGNDDLNGDTGDDRLGGDSGNDMLEGDFGADLLVGGSGTDEVRGSSGNDSLTVKEDEGTTAVSDVANCGSGTDAVQADLRDEIAANCETRDVSAVGETPLVRVGRGTLRLRRSGRVSVRLRCPRGVGSLGCKGRLSVRLGVRGARRARNRYGIRAGRSKTVTVRLSRGSVRTLRRRQRRGRRTRAVLASIERGRLGRKTRVRYPHLRLSRR